jgi:YhcH/YjgK/YiaL family protein
MIIDRLEYADRYVALHPQFGAAFRFLRNFDAATSLPGKHSLDETADESESNPFLIIEKTDGRGREKAQVEYHRRYIDIQYVAEGTEVIGWIPIGHCQHRSTEFDSTKDIGFFDDRPTTWLTIPTGCFAIFFPEDGHAPLAGDQPVHKVVVKIPQSPEQILQELKDELGSAHTIDPERAARLEQSIDEVQLAIANRQSDSDSDSLSFRLRSLAQEFEVSHPRLTHTVGRVADALAQIGI